MSKKTIDIIITEKLEQLPLPDMRDAIWSRIEEQLDADLPTDEGPSPDAPTSPDWAGLLTRFGLSAVVIGLITVFLLKKTTTTAPAIPAKETTAILKNQQATDTETTAPFYPETKEQEVVKKEVPPDEGDMPPLLSPPLQDAVSAAPVVVSPMVPPDSLLKTAPLLLDAAPVKQDSVKKKSRGVQGIKDSDYRIVPQKDSLP